MGAVPAAQMEEIDHENKQVSNFLVSDVAIFPPYLLCKSLSIPIPVRKIAMWLRGVDVPPIVQQIQIGNR